ncbi:hypothetical protein P175DRAFT_0440239 [Aspergillus ochraceoroseus IBT 24754]|uniref:Uncharacterized protein n=1 Tax=Aspergillus ochraceoroseus IBT 24754 TaxID=1392256 RepID=A0A2T5LUH7_9EURO|nr:uncharacterized protein P175DRAFT_0440239 [Aspergillus ochraceoroseus IBT 24754]PTU19927.1 hypothetical protein P175DRAFT_0440239 [Aspergillus ochraceoroseus IBT 24754]
MCKMHVTTTRYSKCPPCCIKVRYILVTGGCPVYAATGRECKNPKEVNLGQTTTRSECPNHRDEGFAEPDTR